MKIYVMGSTAHVCRYKIGISKNVANRRKNIESTIEGRVYVIFSCPLLFAYFWEQLLHGIYAPLNVKNMKGSGRTEWFTMIAPITPILLILAAFCFELSVIGAMVIGAVNFTIPQTQSSFSYEVQKVETKKEVKKRRVRLYSIHR